MPATLPDRDLKDLADALGLTVAKLKELIKARLITFQLSGAEVRIFINGKFATRWTPRPHVLFLLRQVGRPRPIDPPEVDDDLEFG